MLKCRSPRFTFHPNSFVISCDANMRRKTEELPHHYAFIHTLGARKAYNSVTSAPCVCVCVIISLTNNEDFTPHTVHLFTAQ